MYTHDSIPQDSEWMKRQLGEAIIAGERAMKSLSDACDKLSSAKKWGIFDMLGGGFIASMIKHSRMEDAAQLLRRAGDDLAVFQDELQDVDVICDIDLETDGFLSFADVFMDSFVADALVQEKIARIMRQAEEALERTGSIVAAMKEKHRML